MKVKNMVEVLMRLPLELDLVFLRDTQHGRVEYDFSHLEVCREVRPKLAIEVEVDDLKEGVNSVLGVKGVHIEGIEETPERCIMVLS